MQIITAYIDGASLNMVIASVAGIAVSLGAVLAVYIRRAKKKISDKLGIDENQKKEVEADVTGSFGED